MKYLFSIIIPVFNSEKFLSRCVESILIQNHKSIEILLINDFSSDKSKLICEEYRNKYNFIKVFNNRKNFGVGISRNKGIQKSKGKYIIFVDSDDCLYINSLKNLEHSIQKKLNPDVIIVRFEKITYPNSNLKLINRNINNNNNTDKLIKYVTKNKFPFADCWFFVTQRDFLIKNKIFFPEIRIGESELFVVKIISFMKRYNSMQSLFYKKIDRDSSLNLIDDYESSLSPLILMIDFCYFINNTSLSKIKKNFAMRYIQDALGIFTSTLIQRKLKERKKLAIKISREIDNLFFLKKIPENLYLYNFMKNQKPIIGILNYIEKIFDFHYKSLQPILTKYKYFFCYCRSKYSLSTIYLLKNYNIKIHGIIDDNEKYRNTIFYNFKTINLSVFLKKNKKIIKDCAIIITHQRESTSNKIIKGMIDRGLSKKQIKAVKF